MSVYPTSGRLTPPVPPVFHLLLVNTFSNYLSNSSTGRIEFTSHTTVMYRRWNKSRECEPKLFPAFPVERIHTCILYALTSKTCLKPNLFKFKKNGHLQSNSFPQPTLKIIQCSRRQNAAGGRACSMAAALLLVVCSAIYSKRVNNKSNFLQAMQFPHLALD